MHLTICWADAVGKLRPPVLIYNMKPKPEIHNPKDVPVQVILTDTFQLGYVLEHLLAFTGPADITVSTYSTGEEFLRKLIALRGKGLIKHSRLYTDFKAAEKTARVNTMLRTSYDEVRFCPNHSKVMVIEGDFPVVVISSQNQTRGNRLENYAVLHSRQVADYCLSQLENLKTFTLYE